MNILGRITGAAPRGFGRLLVLAYEHVGDAASGGSDPRQAPAAVDADEFAWQMERVAQRFRPIALSRLMGHLGGKQPLSGPQICVSLHSDSLASHRLVFAVLSRLNLVATWFVAFECIGQSGPDDAFDGPTRIGWAELRALAAAGGDVAHRVRAGAELAAPQRAQRRAQLSALRSRAEKECGVAVRAFAYGGQGSGTEPSLIHDAAIAGFSLGVNGSAGVNPLRPISPMSLLRTRMTAGVGRAQFDSLLDRLERGR